MKNMTRFDKLEYLPETCSEKFIKDCDMLRDLVRWMSEKEFNEFFYNLIGNRNIKDPTEVDDEEAEEADQFVFTA